MRSYTKIVARKMDKYKMLQKQTQRTRERETSRMFIVSLTE